MKRKMNADFMVGAICCGLRAHKPKPRKSLTHRVTALGVLIGGVVAILFGMTK